MNLINNPTKKLTLKFRDFPELLSGETFSALPRFICGNTGIFGLKIKIGNIYPYFPKIK